MPSNEQIVKILVLVNSMTFNCNAIQDFILCSFHKSIKISEATQRNVV